MVPSLKLLTYSGGGFSHWHGIHLYWGASFANFRVVIRDFLIADEGAKFTSILVYFKQIIVKSTKGGKWGKIGIAKFKISTYGRHIHVQKISKTPWTDHHFGPAILNRDNGKNSRTLEDAWEYQICSVDLLYSATILNCFGVACENDQPLMRLSILFGIKYFEAVCTLWYQRLQRKSLRVCTKCKSLNQYYLVETTVQNIIFK